MTTDPVPTSAGQRAAQPPCESFAGRLLRWHASGGRHDLPWQNPRTPYRVWLSEIMLQQTQVKTAAPFFERFVTALPDLPALAAAPQDRVLALWSGLGYYARARNLHAAARHCVAEHDGELPRDPDALIALPGIGRSTAAAILSQVWGDRHAILDGNVKRVLARVHGIEGWPGLPAVEKRLWAIAERHVDDPLLTPARMADYTQAQMDLGATVCTRSNPACMLCPLQDICVARLEGRVAELPTPRPGKLLPQRHAHVLWLEDAEGRVLLERRPPVGIWASLWSLPQLDADSAAVDAWLRTHVDAPAASAEVLPSVAHAFSHYRLDLLPLRWRNASLRPHVADNEALRWVSRGELADLGIPAPVRRLLES
ncbi:A/G-specific adenine glycosylase [Lysobacter korlensis]|uniref:Adenine DNA glycosylase n=1 Tax=Lysobacter korlensis TaxID=553636 RepID=A0ABV6RQS5_9GAMM